MLKQRNTLRLTEKEFMGHVIQLAKLTGWKVYHTHNSRHSVAGFPDLILLRAERLLAIELKVGKNTATSEQAEWLRAFHVTGAFTAVWTPNEWPEIQIQLANG